MEKACWAAPFFDNFYLIQYLIYGTLQSTPKKTTLSTYRPDAIQGSLPSPPFRDWIPPTHRRRIHNWVQLEAPAAEGPCSRARAHWVTLASAQGAPPQPSPEAPAAGSDSAASIRKAGQTQSLGRVGGFSTVVGRPNEIHYWSLTARPCKMVVGRLLSYWDGNFSGAKLNFGGVLLELWPKSCCCLEMLTIFFSEKTNCKLDIHPSWEKIWVGKKVCLDFLFIAKDFVPARSNQFYVGGSSTLVLWRFYLIIVAFLYNCKLPPERL